MEPPHQAALQSETFLPERDPRRIRQEAPSRARLCAPIETDKLLQTRSYQRGFSLDTGTPEGEIREDRDAEEVNLVRFARGHQLRTAFSFTLQQIDRRHLRRTGPSRIREPSSP